MLILDEPTRGIDVGAKREIYDIVDQLCAAGVGVILISSELPEVLTLSDRIVVMCQGRLVAELDGATATEELVMTHAVGADRMSTEQRCCPPGPGPSAFRPRSGEHAT